MLITLMGPPGSGKGTIGKTLARDFDLKFHSVGDIRRELAQSGKIGGRVMTIVDLGKYDEEHAGEIDLLVDEETKRIFRQEDGFVLDGRMAGALAAEIRGEVKNKEIITIYLDVSFREGAKRIFADQRRSEKGYSTLQELVEANKERVKMDSRRYKKLYGIDPFADPQNQYDLYVNTTGLTPQQIVDKIKEYIAALAAKAQ